MRGQLTHGTIRISYTLIQLGPLAYAEVREVSTGTPPILSRRGQKRGDEHAGRNERSFNALQTALLMEHELFGIKR